MLKYLTFIIWGGAALSVLAISSLNYIRLENDGMNFVHIINNITICPKISIWGFTPQNPDYQIPIGNC